MSQTRPDTAGDVEMEESGNMADRGLDADQLEATVLTLRDPLLRRILFAVEARPGSTIRQIAERLGEPPRRVRHHLTGLLEARLVVIDEERHRGGVIERTYGSVALPLLWGAAWPREIGDVERKWVVVEVIKMIVSDMSAALRAGTFTRRPGWQATRVSREVDERGWSELVEAHSRAFEETMRIVDRSTRRLERTAEKAITVVSGVLLFEADSTCD
jgi:DNA-binding transcriptional ArsR family regulator